MLFELGNELREGRVGAGLSQADVGRAVGVSTAQVSRIERALLPHVALGDLVGIAATLGLDLSARLYPVGDPIRDAAHVALLRRLQARLHPTLSWRTEVPLPLAGDRRAWDAVIRGIGFLVAVEAETRLHDVQSMSRRLASKRRDGGVDAVILLVADTRHNRAALDAAASGLRSDFSGDARSTLRSLGGGQDPGRSSIIVL